MNFRDAFNVDIQGQETQEKVMIFENLRGISEPQKRNKMLMNRLNKTMDKFYYKAENSDESTGDYDLFFDRFNIILERELKVIKSIMIKVK